MKRLNCKGIGHHLLIIAVVVTAVVGAAGYFVWQRQKDNDISAKAAGYTYLNPLPGYLSGEGGGRVPNIDWYACKIKLPNNRFSVTIIAKSTTKERTEVGVGYPGRKLHSKYWAPGLKTHRFPSFSVPADVFTVFNTAIDKEKEIKEERSKTEVWAGNLFKSYKLSLITATC